jgi:hypothetical protein
MAYVASWLNDEMQNQEIKLLIEDTLSDLKRRSGLINTIAPLKSYDDRNFVAYLTESMNIVASIIAYGGEIPSTQVGRFSKMIGELFKAGLSYDYPEERQWAIRDAVEVATRRGVQVQDAVSSDGTIIPGSNNTLADYLFGTIKSLTESQVTLLDSLFWQILQFGQVAYTDPRTNTSLTLDYKDPNATYNHFPSAKVGADAWTAYTTANGVRDLDEDIETFVDTNGVAPSMIVMSRKLRRHLLSQESTKQAVASINNTAAATIVNAVGTVSPEMLVNVLQMRDLPPIVTFDELYKTEDVNKNFTNARFLNTNRYIFITPGMGERAMGPTLEGDGAPGIFVKVRQVTDFPPRDVAQTVATMLPVVYQPKLLFSRQVSA